HVEADMDEAEIAPEAALEDPPRRGAARLDQLDRALAEEPAEAPLAAGAGGEQDAAERDVAAGEPREGGGHPLSVVEDAVVTEHVAVQGERAVDVRHPDQAAGDAPDHGVALGPEPIAPGDHLEQVAEGIADEEMLVPERVAHQGRHD